MRFEGNLGNIRSFKHRLILIENENPGEFGQKVNVISLLILASMLKMDCKNETKKTLESQPKDGGKNPGQQRITHFRKLIKQVMKGDRFGTEVKTEPDNRIS